MRQHDMRVLLIAAAMIVAGCSTATDVGAVHSIGIAGGPYAFATSHGATYLTAVTGTVRFNLTTITPGPAVRRAFSIATGVTFNSLGTRAYISDQGAFTVWVVNVATNAVIDAIPTHGAPVPMVVVDSTLFVTTNSNYLYKIDLRTKVAMDSIALPATSHHMLLAPNGTTLYVATRDGGTVLEVNRATMSVTRTIQVGGRTQAMAFSPDHQTLYVANEVEPYVFVVSLASGTVTDSIALDHGAFGIALSPDGARLYAGEPSGAVVQTVNVVTHEIIRTSNTGGLPRHILVDTARERVLVANEAGWVDVLDP
jgi:YVTN family beta-propeller protein